MSYVYCDIETNGLNPDIIWCVACKYGDEVHVFTDQESFLKYMEEHKADTWVGHNFLGFDIPVLERLYGADFESVDIEDTLVMSRLSDPSRSGGHSLRSWGNRLGFPKGDHSDWSCYSEEMKTYCIQDVEVTESTHKAIQEELEGFSRGSLRLEHEVQQIIQRQIKHGWLLNQRLATELSATFKEEFNAIEKKLQEIFPPIVTERVSDKTGRPLKPHVEDFNPGSRQQIAKRLETLGAKWTEFTDTGRPVINEVTLKPLSETMEEAAAVRRYLLLQKRDSQVSSWLKHVEEDGRVHGRVTTNGAVTGRMTHQNPNMAQVPNSGAEYGEECRSCWVVAPGNKLVGFDASGLELRMLAHYMNDEEFTNVLLREDIHTRNQVAAGLDTRPQAKTFIYAFLYGAGDAKIGSIVGGSDADGRKLKQRFLRNTPALEALRERVGKASGKGFLVGLDGRRVHVRSSHAALNTLLQSAGAIVMKKALVLLDEYAKKWKLEYEFVGNIHDEVQTEVLEAHADKFGYLGVECLKAAGLAYDLRCPLDGEYKVGDNWSQTH